MDFRALQPYSDFKTGSKRQFPAGAQQKTLFLRSFWLEKYNRFDHNIDRFLKKPSIQRKEIMTLLQLTYFVELCRTNNFTRAAENLNVTQPTVSNAVRDLELEFGLKLLERDNRHLALTPAGEELWDMALQLLSYADEIRLVMQDLIRSGEGCGYLIEGTYIGEGIVGIPFEEELPVTLWLVWTRESERHTVVKKALRAVREYLSAGEEA